MPFIITNAEVEVSMHVGHTTTSEQNQPRRYHGTQAEVNDSRKFHPASQTDCACVFKFNRSNLPPQT
jgi:hypothetical protein